MTPRGGQVSESFLVVVERGRPDARPPSSGRNRGPSMHRTVFEWRVPRVRVPAAGAPVEIWAVSRADLGFDPILRTTHGRAPPSIFRGRRARYARRQPSHGSLPNATTNAANQEIEAAIKVVPTFSNVEFSTSNVGEGRESLRGRPRPGPDPARPWSPSIRARPANASPDRCRSRLRGPANDHRCRRWRRGQRTDRRGTSAGRGRRAWVPRRTLVQDRVDRRSPFADSVAAAPGRWQ